MTKTKDIPTFIGHLEFMSSPSNINLELFLLSFLLDLHLKLRLMYQNFYVRKKTLQIQTAMVSHELNHLASIKQTSCLETTYMPYLKATYIYSIYKFFIQ